ncbi:MAG: tripartite tricarboxylate transporter substrate binding protein [Betaproteobacteria bacterium]|nr:MAG: tripartite tricarboxylate transporter substrate binding protein [Betaproteobacteria bacterium]
MRYEKLGVVLLVATCAFTSAYAQKYPERPITLVIPFPPGASTDAFGRLIAQRMALDLKQQVVVVNRDGAAGVIGTNYVARSAPDGYTLLWGTSSGLAIMPALKKKLPYDPQRDFAPISLGAKVSWVLAVHPSVPADNVKALVALAKKYPGKLNFASAGTGGAPHLAGELFKATTGIDVVHIPYRGTALFAVDLVAGQVDYGFASPLTTQPFTRTGRLRALAVTAAKRLDVYPEVPTMGEAGYPTFELTQWYAMVAPAGTPAGIIATLNAAVRNALTDPNVVKRLANDGGMPAPTTPEGLAAFIRDDTASYAKIAEKAGIKTE